MSVPDKFLKPYDPAQTEPSIYKKWEDSGYFNPDNLPGERTEPFTIIMPPPNANGSLHVGHALFVTIQDLLVRYKRMRGYKTLWLPGADHAGFETQLVYEKVLEKEGRSRFKMPREEFYKETLAFTFENKKYMEGQLRQLGASCDWSRNKFTLDPDIVKTVYDTFKKLHDDGLVYRGVRPVNWSTKYQTSLSDLETKSLERKDPLYYLKYGPFILATVRPETKFGDTAVAVNPNAHATKSG
jgi:valyl-tRNA synthetase